MSSRNKTSKQNKSVFTIVTDRLCEDSSQQLYGQAFEPENELNLQGFEFPLNYELEEIHQTPSAYELSQYIKHLQSQVKSITNKIEFEYHQARETVLFVGQTTNMLRHVSRKKVDNEFSKMGIVRKYQPKMRERDDLDQETLAKDAGDLAIDQIKQKIQGQWECQISDEMEKERRRLKELEKKRLKELQQIDKDFEKLMKKRKSHKQLQAQFRSQQSMKSLQNADSISNKAPKKVQKREKIQRKGSQKNNRQKNSQQGSRQKNSIQQSDIQSCSVMNNNDANNDAEENSANSQMQINQESRQNLKINLLEASESNHWKHQQMQKPLNGIESNQNLLENNHDI